MCHKSFEYYVKNLVVSIGRDKTQWQVFLNGVCVFFIRQVLIVDSRSFLEYNDLHVIGAVNVCCSKLVKRRLQQDKVPLSFSQFVLASTASSAT